jgi:hypothetical protein
MALWWSLGRVAMTARPASCGGGLWRLGVVSVQVLALGWARDAVAGGVLGGYGTL